MNVHVKILADERREKKNGTYPVKLRVTFRGKQKWYPTGTSFDLNTWNKIDSSRCPKKFRSDKAYLNAIELKAEQIIRDIRSFSFAKFEKLFDLDQNKQSDILTWMKRYLDQLRSEGRVSSSDTFNSAINSIKAFLNSEKHNTIEWENLDVIWLKRYEKWMLLNGRSRSTIGIYIRNIRTVYNLAIDEGVVSKDLYPFGKRKYQIPTSNNLKRALKHDQIRQILNYTPCCENEEKAKDLWVLSYLLNGANFADIARLRYENIEGEKIIFRRRKTINSTKHNAKPIVCPLNNEIRRIIERWGQKPRLENQLIFDLIEQNASIEKQVSQSKQSIKTVNKWMKRIGKSLGFEDNITTYTARHSFATISKNKNVPIQYISECLGHTSLTTTDKYFSTFEDNQVIDFHNQLLDF